MTIEHLPADTSADKVADALERTGVVVVDEVAGGELLDTVKAELDPFVAATATGPDDFSGHQTRRTGALVARSPAARGLITHPLVLDSVGQVLHHSASFQLHLTQIIALGPGQASQYIHRDQWAFDHFPFPTGYQVQCNTIWAMTDFTEANGATRVIPGSHRFDDGLHFT
jgi:ectoine hydroxylase-related dioxygenase (phytanoyl-CoA dioxygenase family)